MKKSILIAASALSLVLAGSPFLAAAKGGGGGGSGGMGGGGAGMSGMSSTSDHKQSQMEKETRKRVEQEKGKLEGKTENARKRTEMEKRERSTGTANKQEKTREQTRATEGKKTEAGKGAEKGVQKQKTERKWWQFWK